jgi:DNA-binding response OmpR family regulator
MRVLIIDDDHDSAQLMRVQLERAGYAVEVALTGEAGIEAVARDKPDLVVLDLRMVPVDGFEVMRRLAADEATRDVPILVVSVVEAGREAAELGARGFILKPFEAGGVAEAALTILAP